MKDLSLKNNSTEYTDIIGFIKQCKNSAQGKDLWWIIVEGIDDLKIYKKLIKFPNVDFCNSEGGKSKVSTIIAQFLKTETTVIGIVDADFSHILNEPLGKNIFLTDYHDIEMMMLSNDEVIENIFQEYLYDIERSKYEDYRSRIFALLKSLSLLKLANYKQGLGLNFKSSWLDFLDFDSNQFDYQSYFTKIQIASGIECTFSSDTAQANGQYDDFQLCNGHDFTTALTKLINNLKSSKRDIRYTQIESELRLSYNHHLFCKTKLYSDLEQWYHLTLTTIP